MYILVHANVLLLYTLSFRRLSYILPVPLPQSQHDEERKNTVIYRIVKSLTSIGICLEKRTCALSLTVMLS